MVNFSIPTVETISQCMPQSACSFYQGYYAMSTDMGSLIIKLGLLFAFLDVIHYFLRLLFESYIIPKLKGTFKKQKSL